MTTSGPVSPKLNGLEMVSVVGAASAVSVADAGIPVSAISHSIPDPLSSGAQQAKSY